MYKKINERLKEIYNFLKEDTSPDERSTRLLLSQEYEAVKTYEEAAAKADSNKAKKVFLDIAREELVHIGELEELLKQLGMSTEDEYNKGALEVKEILQEGTSIKE